jgi:hypothetical protein
MRNAAPVMYAAAMTCGNAPSCTLLNITAQKSVISARPVVGL